MGSHWEPRIFHLKMGNIIELPIPCFRIKKSESSNCQMSLNERLINEIYLSKSRVVTQGQEKNKSKRWPGPGVNRAGE